MHVGLAINYCSWVLALTPCVSPQKMVLLCKLFLVLFKETLFIWGTSLVAQTVKNLPAIRDTWVHSTGWENPMEKGTATHSSIWEWIFFNFYCKNVPSYSRVERQAVLQWTHHTISIAINMVPELFHQLPHPKNTHILFNFAGIF